MKTIKHIAAVAALFAVPLAALAQAQTPIVEPGLAGNDALTRSQVKQDQARLEHSGYDTSTGDQASYPRQVQAAEARVGNEQVREATSGEYTPQASSGYGGAMPGSDASGGPAQPAHTGAPGMKPTYFGN
ncbi:uncharacterized protein DUF4148 [Paraburkholderia eburnea]|uniref:Uncharacterized protein DUF4148 n=1 Tax=Paraburkholderia eburnea TaxID=1189126 RepID=A0A2S4MAJ4_9BURK|nr:DUF4148 domain-containing protein [Paraburkholderia eburnea]POR51671.1 uncharacterized protein DUF4148 [Paraburkholderia eburnea]PRZ22702.1 uncharacterized protein DUF4148 [Paraburkholderia eburnea]